MRAHPALYDPPEIGETVYNPKTQKAGLCILNGVEAKGVFAADTEAGWIKTWDVFGDGQPRLSWIKTEWQNGEEVPVAWYSAADFPGRDVDIPRLDVLSETLHGEVEIWGPEL